MKNENKDLIGKLFDGIEEKVIAHEIAQKLSKCTRVRLKNGRIIDIFLLALSDDTAAISLIDIKTEAEVCTVDVRRKDLQYVNLKYKKACEIYNEILDRDDITIIGVGIGGKTRCATM